MYSKNYLPMTKMVKCWWYAAWWLIVMATSCTLADFSRLTDHQRWLSSLASRVVLHVSGFPSTAKEEDLEISNKLSCRNSLKKSIFCKHAQTGLDVRVINLQKSCFFNCRYGRWNKYSAMIVLISFGQSKRIRKSMAMNIKITKIACHVNIFCLN